MNPRRRQETKTLRKTFGRSLTISLVVFGLALTVHSQSAQTTSSVTPAQVDDIFAKWNRTDSPGCALAVMQHGGIVYEHGYGMADLEHSAVITPSTPFHVASVSKQFTAAAVLLLAEQGKLSLDDDIRKYLPEMADFGTTIRIRNLLHHTSGLRDQWDLLGLAGWRYSLDLITDDDAMSLITRQKELNFAPGSEYLYSNTGFTLAGQIVKKVSGLSLREFTTKNIFEPLGMKNTHFRDDHAEIIKGEALGYVPGKDREFRLSITNFDTVGATSLYTTVEDMAKWDETFYSPKIGGPDFTARMTQTEKLTNGQDNNYALGLVVGSYRGLPTVEHGGADAGYRSNIIRFPQQHFSVVSLCNTPVNPTALDRKVADLYLAADFTAPALVIANERDSVKLPPEKLAGKEGFYLLESAGVVIKIASENGTLEEVRDDDKRPLIADGKGHFQAPDSPIVVHFEPDEGDALHLVIETPSEPPQVWKHLAAFALASGAEKEYAGSYYSDELDVAYRIEDDAGKLVLKRKKNPDQALTPVIRDLFTGGEGVIEFTRDSSGHVSGMSLSTGRIRHLKFTRQQVNSKNAPTR
jgi:CubicO group peptidase (beta-lactamase class C family)